MHLDPDLDFIRQVKKAGGADLKTCMQCATCSVSCKLAPPDRPFPRKEMAMAQWGLKEALLSDPDIWLCHQCNDCSTRCPRQAKPGDVLAAVRSMAFRHYAFPSFMGQALASPAALPLLLLIPALILLGVLAVGSQGEFGYLFAGSGEVDYAHAFPHGLLEMLFIGGNLLIFAFAAVGLMRFWNAMKAHTPAGMRSPGFLAAMTGVAMEILPHSKFGQCGESKPRQLGHLLIFYGFIGAMITAGLALFFTIILETLGSPFFLHSPIDLPNPIKILGVASGLAMLIGGGMLISRRLSGDSVSGYQDWLFLIAITLVGLTGMLAWALRLAEIPVVAYLDYYLHLVLVFFLLWYAPYSKFAHMFYRTLALVYARSSGRELVSQAASAAPVAPQSKPAAA